MKAPWNIVAHAFAEEVMHGRHDLTQTCGQLCGIGEAGSNPRSLHFQRPVGMAKDQAKPKSVQYLPSVDPHTTASADVPSICAALCGTTRNDQLHPAKRAVLQPDESKPVESKFVTIRPSINMDNTYHLNGLAYVLNCASHPRFTSHRALQYHIQQQLKKASRDEECQGTIFLEEAAIQQVRRVETMYKDRSCMVNRSNSMWNMSHPGYCLQTPYLRFTDQMLRKLAIRDFMPDDFVRYRPCHP